MWKAFCNNQETEHQTFQDAFKRIFDYVKQRMETGPMSWQELENFIWIIPPEAALPLNFYDCRDIAIDSGYIRDGEWVVNCV